MASWSGTPLQLMLGLLFLLCPITTTAIIHQPSRASNMTEFHEALTFRNGDECGSQDTYPIHIAMTLDVNYLLGTIAAAFSLLQHSTCPENLTFHFLQTHFKPQLFSSIKSTFPYLNFTIYHFDSNRVRGKISKSIGQALD